jgi:outer membrane protein, multidrug efflux system
MNLVKAAVYWLALLSPTGALAQTESPEGIPGEKKSADTAPTLAESADAGIPVDDPLLEPIPDPPHVLKDWREALDYVRTRSPDLLTAHAQVEVARGQSRMALAGSLPRLVGNASWTYQVLRQTASVGGITQPSSVWRVGGTATLPVLAARNWYDYATSRDQIAQAELQAEDAERLIIGGLAESLVAVITAERLSEVTRVNFAAALSTVELNKRRTRLGAGNAIDVLRAEQEAAQSRTQVIEADETLRRAREALGRALGYPEAWGVATDVKLDQLRADARNTCKRSEDIQDRADIRAAAAGAAIAQRNVTSPMLSLIPTIDLNSTVTYNSAVNFSSFQKTTWTIGAALTWHLYDGGLRYGETHRNKALAEQSRQTRINTELGARIEVIQATRGVDVARQTLEVAEQSRQIADDNAALAKTKFISGTGTSFDMVDTQRTARQTKLDVTVKEFELLRAEIIAFLALASCTI